VTNSETPTTPAGWYPDPEGVQRQRWWDGQKWTADVAPSSAPQPYSADRHDLKAPAGTDWNTPWIWILLVLPLLPALSLLFIDWSQLVDVSYYDTGTPDINNQLALYTSPGYLFTVIGGWVAYALSVVLAYLDFKALRDRGVPAPFHWAWGFLGPFVYAIGRGIVTNRRTGKGMVIVWAAVGVLVVGLILGGITTAIVMNAVFSQLPGLYGLPTN
jgi:hypothetical protein